MRACLVACALLLGSATTAQPTPCRTAPAGYDGPCYYGALPTVFDDFAYRTAPATGPATAGGGNLFGTNAWHMRDGVEASRAWYRYNRDSLPMSGSITPQAGSVLRLELPGGGTSEDFKRAAMIVSGFTMLEGTYHWRVKLSDLWPGQWVRQAVWTISPKRYFFDNEDRSVRYDYWSELDFENENHYQGEHRNGRYYPDFLPRMQVTNHFGHRILAGRGHTRLSRNGETAWENGTGTLVRSGFARGSTDLDAPHLTSWAHTWWHLMIYVDGDERTVTYRMIPANPTPETTPVSERSVTVSPEFYPEDAMSAILSLHWLRPEGTLEHDLWMEADWFYFSPTVGLSDAEVVRQVEHLRRLGHERTNTTNQPTFSEWKPSGPPEASIAGPRAVACGEAATWKPFVVNAASVYLTTFRYRTIQASGDPGPWRSHYERTLTLRPKPGQATLEIEAHFQDAWAPYGSETNEDGWLYPHPDNYAAEARLTATFTCAER